MSEKFVPFKEVIGKKVIIVDAKDNAEYIIIDVSKEEVSPFQQPYWQQPINHGGFQPGRHGPHQAYMDENSYMHSSQSPQQSNLQYTALLLITKCDNQLLVGRFEQANLGCLKILN